MLASPLLGLWLRMPHISTREQDAEMLADPEVRLALTEPSGPLVVEIEYRIPQENARAFHNLMQNVQLYRQNRAPIAGLLPATSRIPNCRPNGIRQRNRSTKSERALDRQAAAFHISPESVPAL